MNRTWIWILTLAGLFVALDAALGSPNDIVQSIATAIATAEGFYVSGSVPQRNNNPGDIESNGQIINYSSVSDGWSALYSLVGEILYGGSIYYNPAMTISQIAQIYTGGDNPTGWASTVGGYLGVDINTPLNQLYDLQGA